MIHQEFRRYIATTVAVVLIASAAQAEEQHNVASRNNDLKACLDSNIQTMRAVEGIDADAVLGACDERLEALLKLLPDDMEEPLTHFLKHEISEQLEAAQDADNVRNALLRAEP